MTSFIDAAKSLGERIEKRSPPETLVDGDPLQSVELYLDLPEQGMKAGFWEGEKGAYRLEFGPQKAEHFTVLSGQIRVHNEDGTHSDFRPGDTCILPPGFRGVFEIVSAARKQFVIVELAR